MELKSTTVTLTTAAAEQVEALIAQEGDVGELALRIEVQPGGCAGFKYGLFFDDTISDADVVEETQGVRVVVDKLSAPYLRGVVIDWQTGLQQSGFVINNPNAEGRCACGDSFH